VASSLLALMPRILLALLGAILIFAGLRLGLNPHSTGFTFSNATAQTNARVLFGGFHSGLGLFALVCALQADTTLVGLSAVATTACAVITFRVLGIAVDGAERENILLLGRESVSIVLLIIAFAAIALRKAST
jgi:Domain of unknown function (DUF4345)